MIFKILICFITNKLLGKKENIRKILGEKKDGSYLFSFLFILIIIWWSSNFDDDLKIINLMIRI